MPHCVASLARCAWVAGAAGAFAQSAAKGGFPPRKVTKNCRNLFPQMQFLRLVRVKQSTRGGAMGCRFGCLGYYFTASGICYISPLRGAR